MKKTIIILAIAGILLVSHIILGFKHVGLTQEFNKAQATLGTRETNENVLNFISLFVEDVLLAESEVGFEARLELEHAVRQLNDKNILSHWDRFIESETEQEAQEKTGTLLRELIKKIVK